MHSELKSNDEHETIYIKDICNSGRTTVRKLIFIH